MVNLIPRRVLSTALVARLDEIANATVYLRRVGFVLGQTGEVPPPTVSSTDKRVRPYIVVHPSAGYTGPDRRLDASTAGRVYTPQITCVAGDETALEPLLDAVAAKLDDWRPTLPEPHTNADLGRFRPLVGYDPGPASRDDDVTPARFWTPLLYRLPVYH